ncbi:hypothetical protein APC33_18220 [Acinetobacter baumannii]|nr:hypothetical protein APC33_18220 [Acinetobacter baumannii]
MDGLDDEYKKIEIISKSYFSNETLEIVINSPLSSKKGYCFISALLHKPICKGFFSDIIFK